MVDSVKGSSDAGKVLPENMGCRLACLAGAVTVIALAVFGIHQILAHCQYLTDKYHLNSMYHKVSPNTTVISGTGAQLNALTAKHLLQYMAVPFIGVTAGLLVLPLGRGIVDGKLPQ